MNGVMGAISADVRSGQLLAHSSNVLFSRKLFLSKARAASLFCQFRSPEPEMSSPEVGNWKATNNRRRQTGTSRRGEKAK